MYTLNVAVLLAAVAVAAPPSKYPDPFGIRYTDHYCKKLHSLPNRNFGINDCIELKTVGSIKLYYWNSICHQFKEHQCHGSFDIVATFEQNQCLDTSTPGWEGIHSFRCIPGHD